MMQLELQTQATLDTVGAENYIRYGVVGPKRQVVGITEPNPIPTSLTVQISVQYAAPSMAQVVLENLILHRVHHVPDQQTTWAIHDPAQQLQVVWAWDFYRMLSYVRLRLCATDEESVLFGALKTLQPNTHLLLDVKEQAGHVHQVHLLTSAPQITDECL